MGQIMSGISQRQCDYITIEFMKQLFSLSYLSIKFTIK